MTFVVDRNINYTNICLSGCRFCAFFRPPGHAEGYVLPWEDLTRKLEETLALGGTGILLQGGLNPDLPLDLLRGAGPVYPAHRPAGAWVFPAGDRFFCPNLSSERGRGYPAPDGGGARLHTRRGGGNSGGPGPDRRWRRINARPGNGWRSWKPPTTWGCAPPPP